MRTDMHRRQPRQMASVLPHKAREARARLEMTEGCAWRCCTCRRCGQHVESQWPLAPKKKTKSPSRKTLEARARLEMAEGCAWIVCLRRLAAWATPRKALRGFAPHCVPSLGSDGATENQEIRTFYSSGLNTTTIVLHTAEHHNDSFAYPLLDQKVWIHARSFKCARRCKGDSLDRWPWSSPENT